MKTRTLLRTSVGIFATGLFAAAALAGPGPQYWNRPAAKPAPKAEAPKTETPVVAKCAGSEVVAVTVMKPSWPNGRGPLTEVQTGTKTVCRMCPVTTVVTTNAWPNGRGPTTRTEVTKTGVEHNCINCAAVAMK